MQGVSDMVKHAVANSTAKNKNAVAHNAVKRMVRPALMISTSGPGSRDSMNVYCALVASSWLRVWSFSCQIPFNHC